MSRIYNGNFNVKNCDADNLAILKDMLRGGWISQCLYISAELGLADHFPDGEAKSSVELSKATGTHEDNLKRLLRILSGIGIFHENVDGTYELTEIGKLLKSQHPNSLKHLAIWYNDEYTHKSMRALEETIKNGKSGSQIASNLTHFEYIDKHPSYAKKFYNMLGQYTGGETEVLLDTLNLYVSKIKSVIDVGGGDGKFLGKILQKYEHLTGIVFDLPAAFTNISEELRIVPKSRWTNIEGDFFRDNIPSKCDLYILKYVLHDFNDEKSLQILKAVHQSILKNGGTGKVLVIEDVIKPNEPGLALFTDMMMLSIGGKERTENDFKILFQNAGFNQPICKKIANTKFYCIEASIK